jgi:hypothetical protein
MAGAGRGLPLALIRSGAAVNAMPVDRKAAMIFLLRLLTAFL